MTTDERLDRIERAIAELGLATSNDLSALSPTNPLSRSGHVQAKLERYLPAASALVREYLARSDSLQSSVERIAEQIQQSHAGAERGRSEGAMLDRNANTRDQRAELYRKAGSA